MRRGGGTGVGGPGPPAWPAAGGGGGGAAWEGVRCSRGHGQAGRSQPLASARAHPVLQRGARQAAALQAGGVQPQLVVVHHLQEGRKVARFRFRATNRDTVLGGRQPRCRQADATQAVGMGVRQTREARKQQGKPAG